MRLFVTLVKYYIVIRNFVFIRLVSAYEDKVIYDPDTNGIYFDLVRMYDNISFVNFVEYVLDEATRRKCFTRSSMCIINEHYR